MLTIKHLAGVTRRALSCTTHRPHRLAGKRMGPLALGAAAVGMLVIAAGATGAVGAAGVDINAVEGQAFSGTVVSGLICSLTSATITWGDGSTSPGTSDGSTGIQGTHTYAEEGSYSGSVSYTYAPLVRQCPSGTQTATFQATVQDASLTGTGVDVSGTAGQALTSVVAHVSDANAAARGNDFFAQISWGDGSTSAGALSPAAGGGFDVSGTHAYNSAGSYPINTTISDIGGASTSATSAAQIAAAADPPPRNTDPPVVSGVTHETTTLTTTNGFWSGSPTAFQYQWLRCATPTGGSCVLIAGATASTYALVHADSGSTMRSRVRATNAVGTSLPADSAPTAPVTPLVLTARFTVAPNPTCTGVQVVFDASGSETPNPPIEHYRITEQAGVGEDPTAPYHTPSPPPWLVLDGTSPRATEVPTYDIRWDDTVPFLPALSGVWQATNRTVTLTVRDRTGASASSTQVLFFAAGLSTDSRAHCPPVHHGPTGGLTLHDVHFKLSRQALNLKIRCPSVTDCIGMLRLDRAFSHRRRRHAKPVVLASSSFYVGGHRDATVTAQLTRIGRALLRHGKSLTAIARLTIVSPTGRTITRSLELTLRAGR